MHGFARDLPFEAHADVHGAGLRMVLTDSEATRGGYPFGFRFEAAYSLVDARTLDVTFTTTNTGNARLPYYAGHHFYFTLPHTQRGETTVELPRTERRYQQDDGSISAAEPGDARYTLDEARIHDRFHCLVGTPDQPVRLVAPGLERVVTIDLQRPGSVPWYSVTTWTEDRGVGLLLRRTVARSAGRDPQRHGSALARTGARPRWRHCVSASNRRLERVAFNGQAAAFAAAARLSRRRRGFRGSSRRGSRDSFRGFCRRRRFGAAFNTPLARFATPFSDAALQNR